jgi:hypothetical protein
MIELNNNYDITSTWNLTSCLSYLSVPYSLLTYHVYSFDVFSTVHYSIELFH